MKFTSKTLFLSLATTISVVASASEITKFECKTDEVIEGHRPTRIEFQVKNLGKRSAEYHVDNEEDFPVKMTPEQSILMLNENYVLVQEATKLKLESDGDGCQLTEMVLYKDAGYRRGYVSVKPIGGCGAEAVYSKVSCIVR